MGTLAEELSNAIDGVELPSGEEAPVVEAAPEIEQTEVTPSITRDERGRFAGKAETPQEVAPETQQPATPPIDTRQATEPAPDVRAMVTPPATWSAPAKAIFKDLPDVARKEIAKREADYARGIQQHAEYAKGYERMIREFQPYEAMLRAENTTPEAAIRELMKTSYILRTANPQQKAQLIMQVAHQFGADLSPYFAPQEQTAGQQDLSQVQQLVQQMVSPALQKIQAWEQGQLSRQEQERMQLEQNAVSQVQAFQSATNEDGSPKHLYFENVKGIMAAYFANGQAQDLEQAYDMACWAVPEVRAALQAEQQRSAETQRLEEAKRKAAQAKSSGFNVSGQGGIGIASAPKTSLRDELAEQLGAAMGTGRL